MTAQTTTIPYSRPSRYRRKRTLIEKFLIWLFAVIVILGAVNLIISGIKTLDRPGKPAPGELIYASTFDAYNEEWTHFTGQESTDFSNGMLEINIDSTDGAYSLLDHPLSDFDVRLNATRLAADDDQNELGILFRFQDDKHYYMFRIRGDGAYRVEMCNACNPHEIDVLSEWQFSPAILTGLNQANQLRVVAQDDHFSFYVNDQRLNLCLKGTDRRSTWTGFKTGACMSNKGQVSNELVDNTFSWGNIGLGVTTSTPGVQVGFDNVVIYGPQTQ